MYVPGVYGEDGLLALVLLKLVIAVVKELSKGKECTVHVILCDTLLVRFFCAPCADALSITWNLFSAW